VVAYRGSATGKRRFSVVARGNYDANRAKGDRVYISAGVLALIIVIILLIWLL
jgi:hypothetical protein